MSQNFTTDVTQWQGVDDEPTAGSDNLVNSGIFYKIYENTPMALNNDFAVTDKNNNAVLIFNEEHIRTKNFDSRNVNCTILNRKRISLLGDSISTFDGKLVPNDLGMFSYYPAGDVLNWEETYWGLLCKKRQNDT